MALEFSTMGTPTLQMQPQHLHLEMGTPTLQKLGASHLCVRIVIDEFLAYHCRRRVANGARGLDGEAERYADLAFQE